LATLPLDVVTQYLDDYALVLAGGLVYTYEAGTTTLLTTYQDYDGEVPNENPIVLDAAGRATIRFTEGVAYKVVIQNAEEETVYTLDDIIVGEAPSESDSQYVISLSYIGTPGASGTMGVHSVLTASTIPIDFDGATGDVITAPAGDYAIDVQKDGVSVGTITIDASGVFTFETTGGATIPLIFGSRLSFHAPSSVGTAADIGITIPADLA
jgi:hypothetical protein